MTPTPTTAIDAETMAKAREALQPGFFDEGTSTEIKGYPTILKRVALAIQAAKAEGDHFKSHFQKLARVNAEANAALDTARREWAKKGEG